MNKKVLILACILVVCLCALCFAACKGGKYEMKDFIVDFSELQDTYQQEDRVDLSLVKITATFTDDSTETIPLDRVKIFLDGTEVSAEEAVTKITETTGTKTVEIKYSTFKKSFVITVEEKHVPVLTGVRLDTSAVATTSYNVGATDVSLAGLKVIAIYDQTVETEVALNAEGLKILMGEAIVSDLNQIAATIGDKVIKVRYGILESSNSLIITVNDVFNSILINVDGSLKSAYKVGDAFAPAGKVTAKAVFASGREDAVTDIKYFIGNSEITDLSTVFATKGNKTITIKAAANGRTASRDFPVTVENFISGITLDTSDVNTLNFVVGDSLSVNTFVDVKVNVAYADASDNEVLSLTSSGVACVDAHGDAVYFANLANAAGEKTVVVTYGGKSANLVFAVADGDTALVSLTVDAVPYAGQTLLAGATGISFDNLAIEAVYKDEYAREPESIFFEDFAANDVTLYLPNGNLLTVDHLDDVTKVAAEGMTDVVISVRYIGKTASFTIKVNNPVVSIDADVSNVSTTVRMDDEPDFSDIVVTATLTYGGTKVVPYASLAFYDGTTPVTDLSDFTKEPSNAKTVTVKYGEQSDTFTLVVEDYIVGIETGTKTTFECDVDVSGNGVFDFAGLELYDVYYSGARVALTSGYSFSDRGISVPETRTVVITKGSFTTSVTLTVNDVLESIAVSNVPTLQYGGSVNFTGLVVTGTYRYGGAKAVNIVQQDGVSYVYGVQFAVKKEGVFVDLTQLTLDTITESSGTREVKLTVNGVFTTFDVTVAEPLPNITGYELAPSFTGYNSNRTYGAANQGNVDSKAFESAFFVSNDDVYLVGDDNPFKFLPELTQVNIETSESTTLTAFKTETRAYLGNVELTAVDNGDNTKTFKNGETAYITESYLQNKYSFSAAALNQTFTLSVKPDSVAFQNAGDFNAVEWTFKVVDGYNVTDSRELCLLEQTTSRTVWNGIKGELGLNGVRPNAIILHQNTMVTKDSIPSDFYYTLSDGYNIKYKYTDGQGVEHSVRPEDVPEEFGGPLTRTYLWGDAEWAIFRYDMTAGSNFTIYGNYFDIDMSKMPLIAGFEPYGVTTPEGMGTFYGSYMSETSFLEVRGVAGTLDASDETFNFSNFAVKGNAGVQMVTVDPTSNIARGGDCPVYGGGLIFVKSRYCHTNITNLHAHACFIPFFSRNETVVNYTNVKAYDSFQNALFVHSDSVNNLINCHMKRAGGPLMILTQGEKDLGGGNTQPLVPEVYADNSCVLESYVTGQSQWFVTYGASSSVTTLSAADALLNGYFHRTFLNNGQFNVIAVSVKDGGIMAGGIDTQAYIEYGTSGKLDRIMGHNVFTTMMQTMGYIYTNGGQMPTTFSVGDYICGISPDNSALIDKDGNNINPQITPSNYSLYMAFNSGSCDYMAINAGGLGVLCQWWPQPQQS